MPTPAVAAGPWIKTIPIQRVQAGEPPIVIDLAAYFKPALVAVKEIEVRGMTGAPGSSEASSKAPVSVSIVPSPLDKAPTALKIEGSGTASGRAYIIATLDFGGAAPSQVATLVADYTHVSQVTFTYKSSNKANSVGVAGSFNGWNPSAHPLTPQADGSWSRSVPIPPGKYMYKFVVDGQWISDPGNPRREADGFGGNNSLLDVSGAAKAGASTRLRPVPGSAPADAVKFLAQVEPEAGKPAPAEQMLRDMALLLSPGTIAVMGGNKILATNNPLLAPYAAAKSGVALADAGDAITISGIAAAAEASPDGILRVVALDRAGLPVSATVYLPPAKTMAPDWRGKSIYFAFTDRFADGSTENNNPNPDKALLPAVNYVGGDWKGITQKIEEGYFDKLGVGAIWISGVNEQTENSETESVPPFNQFTAYHGYWPTSPTATNPHFGSMEDLRGLVAAAHKRGIRVLLDFVCAHVHEDHPWHREHPEWFGALMLPNGDKNIRKFDEFPFTTWFDDFIPKIDYAAHPAAVEAMSDNGVWWLKQTGADGFRQDAVKHIPMEFWRALTRKLVRQVEWEEGRKVFQVGETISGRPTIKEFVSGELLDGQFDFASYWPLRESLGSQTRTCDDFARELEASYTQYDPESFMSPLMGNHDVTRYMAFADGGIRPGDGQDEKTLGWKGTLTVKNPARAYPRLELAQATLLTLPGNPMLYYGDEIGLTGAGDPDNRRAMKFEPGLSAPERGALQSAQKLGTLRTKNPALLYGDFQSLGADADSLAYARVLAGRPGTADQAIVVLIQRANAARTHRIALPANLAGAKTATLLHATTGPGVNVELVNGQLRVGLFSAQAVIVELK